MQAVMDKRYVVTKPAFKAHYVVATPDGEAVYFVAIKTKIKPSKPRLTFHVGASKEAPVVAVLHFQVPNVIMKVGLGDPAADTGAVEWEDLSCLNKVTHAKYTWSMTIPDADGAPQRRQFTWTRTRNRGIEGVKPTRGTNRHWKLAEDGSDEIVALFTGQAKIGHCGTLAMCEDMGEKFHRMALVTLMGLYDRARSAGGG
ncbi:hypothetical protein NLG97_g5769 [Lecanicillium saksenae]|uniref:Uncharacterized protein n=1 Tax=Lecanicillium saksenae TaxID=468837 RepID=A0ACC1QT74_9HYPO|nr:hypothetical protein NLG97_g5769 [Lecanicillium saksenae]